MKRNALRWFEYIERMKNEGLVRKVYLSETAHLNSRGRLLGRWKDRVKEYKCERDATRGGWLEQAMKECLDREG